jgi:FHA domain
MWFGTRSDRHSDSSAETRDHKEKKRHCLRCRKPCQPGKVFCSICGASLSEDSTTKVIPIYKRLAPADTIVGGVFVKKRQLIFFQIGEFWFTLPLAETVVIGRQSVTSPDPQADVGLDLFGAQEHGVSRRHARIRRGGDVIYICDLDSANGTFLNGRRLVSNQEQILRSGDELKLGRLTIKVEF